MARITTPTFRVSFPSLVKPSAMEGGEPKYSVTMLFPKETDLTQLRNAASQAAVERWGDKIPKGLRSPFRDGDEKDLDGYAGTFYVRASSTNRVGVVAEDLAPLDQESDLPAGYYARAIVTPFAYDKNGNKGVSFGLQAVQRVRRGEMFGDRVNAMEAFEPLPVEDRDADRDPFGE